MQAPIFTPALYSFVSVAVYVIVLSPFILPRLAGAGGRVAITLAVRPLLCAVLCPVLVCGGREAVPVVAVMRGLVVASVGVYYLCAHADNPSRNAKLGHGRAVYCACVQAAPADCVKFGVFGLGGYAALLGVCGHDGISLHSSRAWRVVLWWCGLLLYSYYHSYNYLSIVNVKLILEYL